MFKSFICSSVIIMLFVICGFSQALVNDIVFLTDHRFPLRYPTSETQDIPYIQMVEFECLRKADNHFSLLIRTYTTASDYQILSLPLNSLDISAFKNEKAVPIITPTDTAFRLRLQVDPHSGNYIVPILSSNKGVTTVPEKKEMTECFLWTSDSYMLEAIRNGILHLAVPFTHKTPKKPVARLIHALNTETVDPNLWVPDLSCISWSDWQIQNDTLRYIAFKYFNYFESSGELLIATVEIPVYTIGSFYINNEDMLSLKTKNGNDIKETLYSYTRQNIHSNPWYGGKFEEKTCTEKQLCPVAILRKHKLTLEQLNEKIALN